MSVSMGTRGGNHAVKTVEAYNPNTQHLAPCRLQASPLSRRHSIFVVAPVRHTVTLRVFDKEFGLKNNHFIEKTKGWSLNYRGFKPDGSSTGHVKEEHLECKNNDNSRGVLALVGRESFMLALKCSSITNTVTAACVRVRCMLHLFHQLIKRCQT